MPRVNRGFNFVQPGGKTKVTRVGPKKRRKGLVETPPIEIYTKYPGTCIVCRKGVNKKVKVNFSNYGIWHLDCKRKDI